MNEIENKEIEEMAKHGCYDGCASGLRKFCDEYDGKPCKNMVRIVSGLYEQGYRNVKDKVVLDKEEYEKLKSLYDCQQGAYMTSKIGDLPLTVEGLRKAVDEITRLIGVQTELHNDEKKSVD